MFYAIGVLLCFCRLFEEVTICLKRKIVMCRGHNIEFVSKSLWIASLKSLGIECTKCQVQELSRCIYGFKNFSFSSDIGFVCRLFSLFYLPNVMVKSVL
jgi:hypothetical protein